MSYRNIRKKTEGFTIIEVLIVLAIAGLIMLVVFMAVPALQRNSRNTQRRNDVSGMLSKIQESSSNNNGRLVNGANEPDILLEGLGFYDGQNGADSTDVDYNIIANGPATLPANVTGATVIIRNNLKCNTSGATAFASNPVTPPAPISIGSAVGNVVTASNANLRNIVIIYAVESNGGNIQVQCTQS